MGFQKAQELIDKIIANTKKSNLKWGRVSDLFNSNEINNQLLKQYVLMQERGGYFYSNVGPGSLNQYNSFYAEIEGGYVFLFQYVKANSNYYIFAVQGSKYSDIIEMNKKEDFQPKLIELNFLIRERLDNHVQYVDLLLEKLK